MKKSSASGVGAALLLVAGFGLMLTGCDGDDAAPPTPVATPQPSSITATGAVASVQAAAGSLKGNVNATTLTFLGVPYAQPPVGTLRWKPPVAASTFTAQRDATQAGARCPQETGAPATRTLASQVRGSEDCLVLNVYAPVALVGASPGVKRPVMVWIHGGANAVGSGDTYDPTPLVESQDLIVVTVNYRLGALGFLAHAAIDAEGHNAVNYGVMDQQLALKWVQDNIGAFGGDKANVTIFGESAGGLNVFSHLISPLSAGLFGKAISESGAYMLTTATLAASETSGARLATALGCTDATTVVACMRGKSVDLILQNEGTINTASAVYAQSTVDGKVLVESQRSALTAGRVNKVPVLQGANAHEGRIFTSPTIDNATYQATLAGYSAIGGKTPAQALAAYSLATYGTPFEAAAAAVGDFGFACAARTASQLLAAAGVPLYMYEFDDANAGPLGATHGAEIVYLMKVGPAGGVGWDGVGASLTLAQTMQGYWGQFAKTGNPNGTGLPDWKPYVAATDNVQYLVPPTPRQDTGLATRHQCSFWTS